MSAYTSMRGVGTNFRPYRNLDAEEREQILADSLKIDSKEVRQKWNISSRTLAHLRYHYREALEELEDENFARYGL